MITKQARETALERFIQSRKGPTQLKQERQAKAAAIIKESASSQVAGYTQGRQGRRPIRVDKLLAKLEKAKHAESQARKDVRGIAAVGGGVTGLGLGRMVDPLLGVTGHSRLARYRAGSVAGTAGGAVLGHEIARRLQKRASFIPPMVIQLALGILGSAE